MKISIVENKTEIKIEEIESDKYYMINFRDEIITDIYYMNIHEIKDKLNTKNWVLIKVEREEKQND